MATAPHRTDSTRKAAVSFTGGKDSMTVLHLIRAPELALQASANWDNETWRADVRERLAQVAGCEVTLLVTFVPAGAKQSFKAHPLEVVELQARALGLPHLVMEVGATPTFLDSYRDNITHLREQHGVQVLATGDMLDVCSSFMPRAAAGTGVELLSPLWGVERGLLLELVWAYGMSPLITCVNTTKFAVKTKDAAGSSGDAKLGEGGGGGAEAGTTTAGEGVSAGSGAAANGTSDAAAAPSTETDSAERKLACGVAAEGTSAEEGPSGSGTSRDGGGGLLLLGQTLDRRLHTEVLLPAVRMYGVDECGEWGEYHTMVTHSRLFSAPLVMSHERKQEGDYAFLAVTSAELLQR